MTPAIIRNAINDIERSRQQCRENECTYSGRLNDAAHCCGSVHDKIDKLTLLINGLLPAAQTIVVFFRELNGGR